MFKGEGLKPVAFKPWFNIVQRAPPHHVDEYRAVAVQVAFESRVLKPGNPLIGSRLKPGAFKLWVNWIQLALPHLGCELRPNATGVHHHLHLERRERTHLDLHDAANRLGVAVQVGFESKSFETRGSRFETRRFQGMVGKLNSTCTAPALVDLVEVATSSPPFSAISAVRCCVSITSRSSALKLAPAAGASAPRCRVGAFHVILQ